MGIRNLNTILKNNCKNSIKRVRLSELAGKKVAVDASIYMYKYKSIYGSQWISAFYGFLKTLSILKCVFVFDGKDFIQDKAVERSRRSDMKKAMRNKLSEVEKAYEQYQSNGSMSETLLPFKTYNSYYSTLTNNRDLISDAKIQEYFFKTRNILMPLYDQDVNTIKSMCKNMGMCVIESNTEAEKTCSMLCHENKVDMVLSEDTDVLAYNTPSIISKLSMGECTLMNMKDVLSELELTPDQFIDMCIVCGSDYSQGLTGIGPVKAYKYIKIYNSIENIISKFPNIIPNKESFDHIKIRNIFKKSNSEIPSVDFPEPDETQLYEIIKQNHVQTTKVYKKLL